MDAKYWKDHYERAYWKHCVNELDDLDAAVAAFLHEVGGTVQARAKAKGQAKGKAKAKTHPNGGRSSTPGPKPSRRVRTPVD